MAVHKIKTVKFRLNNTRKGAMTSRALTRVRPKPSADENTRLILHVLLKSAENVTVKPVKANQGTLIQIPVEYVSDIPNGSPPSSNDNGTRALLMSNTPPAVMHRNMG